jgi:hypothetical protein
MDEKLSLIACIQFSFLHLPIQPGRTEVVQGWSKADYENESRIGATDGAGSGFG